MKKTIVVASKNDGKIKEIKEIFNGYNVLSIVDVEKLFNKKISVNESQDTFVGNALEKVRDLYSSVDENYICIADDSGLSIDYLNGFPGVYTARWMDALDHIKNLELIKKLEGVHKSNRICHYTTVISLKTKNCEKVFLSTLDGVISDTTKGSNGFGFDEIFELDNGLTLAEISMEDKLSISPRKKALEQLKDYIEKYNF